jgi:PKD repeat protein
VELTVIEIVPVRPPIASFTYTPEHPVKDQEIKFNASSSYDPDGTIINYSWDFSDGTNATGIVVNHTYTWTGLTDQRYNVTLNVTDDLGLTNTTTIPLLIAAIDSIVVEDAEAVWDLTIQDTPDVDYLVGEPGVMVTKYADTFSYFSLDNATAIGRLHGEPGVMVTKYADTFMLEGLTAPPFAP